MEKNRDMEIDRTIQELNKKRNRIYKPYRDTRYLNMSITSVERTRSNRGRCRCCRKMIGKDTIRGTHEYYKHSRHCMYKNYYCSDCTMDKLKSIEETNKTCLNLIRKRKKSRKKAYQSQEDLRKKDEMLRAIENG